MHKLKKLLTLGLVFSFAGLMSCTQKQGAPVTLEVNLYSGVQGVAKIGDSESQLLDRGKRWNPEVIDGGRQVSGERATNWSKVYAFKDLGMKVYFVAGRVALIELQEPFRGKIQGKKMQIFSFAPPEGSSWEDTIVKEFGTPQVKASGGRFGAEAFFYAWGDISFNRMGPNELAIYRDREISPIRQKSFGRDVKFFK